jgi:2-keto-4-pentenoate hydratase/2-oxohepta-3-ene-1,7-dioic acid hydratase in catechol pathway
VGDVVPELAGISDVGALLRAGNDAWSRVQARAGGEAAVEDAGLVFAPPVIAPSKVICVGLNYGNHAAEGGMEKPPYPVLFAKFQNALVGAFDPVIHPASTAALDYEGELAVVIGRRAAMVPVEEAGEYVAGYMVADDISARDIQHGDPGGQWLRGKSYDTFAPLGPLFVSCDQVPDWREIRIRTWVNGDLRQDCSCRDMLFGVEELVAFISGTITLEPGDVVLTGTPSGVGLGFDPPRWLQPGDLVEVELTGLGRQRSPIVSSDR